MWCLSDQGGGADVRGQRPWMHIWWVIDSSLHVTMSPLLYARSWIQQMQCRMDVLLAVLRRNLMRWPPDAPSNTKDVHSVQMHTEACATGMLIHSINLAR